MRLLTTFRTIDKRLRVLLLATALLFVCQIGQFITIRDLNTATRVSDLALLFSIASLFLIPTSLILSIAILFTIRNHWRQHQRLALLGLFNLVIILNLSWFFLHQCSWSYLVGIPLKLCR